MKTEASIFPLILIPFFFQRPNLPTQSRQHRYIWLHSYDSNVHLKRNNTSPIHRVIYRLVLAHVTALLATSFTHLFLFINIYVEQTHFIR